MNVLWVALGGAIGSVARHGVNVWWARLFGSNFPANTLLVNVVGCFVMGLLAALFALKADVSQNTKLFLMTGILGGFTTFSAFALDVAALTESRPAMVAVSYVLASVVLSIIGVFAGLALGRAIAA